MALIKLKPGEDQLPQTVCQMIEVGLNIYESPIELAKLIGSTHSHIWQVRARERNMPILQVIELGKLLGMSLERSIELAKEQPAIDKELVVKNREERAAAREKKKAMKR